MKQGTRDCAGRHLCCTPAACPSALLPLIYPRPSPPHPCQADGAASQQQQQQGDKGKQPAGSSKKGGGGGKRKAKGDEEEAEEEEGGGGAAAAPKWGTVKVRDQEPGESREGARDGLAGQAWRGGWRPASLVHAAAPPWHDRNSQSCISSPPACTTACAS